ncbi:MAG: hypothetical protein DRQ46_01630 [Gammaproteobacteria bacterium]|nr:MAG: hypothetical protein DRQ46_01630 [Gammaproteobacteria bacterium]
MKWILGLAVLAMVGCSKEPVPIQIISTVPHQMPVKSIELPVQEAPLVTVELRPVFFKLGESNINRNQIDRLESHAAILIDDPFMRIQLVGNASSEGDVTDNKQLAQMRADVVKNYLITTGIDAGRLTTTSRSIALNQYSGDKEVLNRRVDFVVMP